MSDRTLNLERSMMIDKERGRAPATRLIGALQGLLWAALLYGLVAGGILAFNAGQARYKRWRSESTIAQLNEDLGEYQIELDHKKGVAVAISRMSDQQKMRALYLALLQLQLQAEAFRDISGRIEVLDATGGKVVPN